MFSQDSLKDTTDNLRDSMYDVGTVAMDLNEKQKERLARKACEERERQEAEQAEQEGNPEDEDDGEGATGTRQKGSTEGGRASRGRGCGKKWPKAAETAQQEEDDDDEADKDWFPEAEEQDTATAKRRRTPSILKSVGLTTQGYKTTKETRHSRYEAKKKEEEEEEPDEEELERQRVVAEQKERLRELQ